MEEALSHSRYGYYQTRDPFGAAGDFITAPEISQVFGELIGLWCAAVWQDMGRPDPIQLIELGPGRATLMSDAIRAVAATVPPFLAAIRLALVERSRGLRARQRHVLAAAGLASDPVWYDRLGEVDGGPSLLIANEFFDALPICQYVRTNQGWCERRIGLAANGQLLAFVLTAGDPERLPPALAEAAPGALVEVCAEGDRLAAEIGARVGRWGGAALIIDYGHERSQPGDTLQAVRRHRFHGVLDLPGEADLTHHVDFEALSRAASVHGARVLGPIPQGLFLSRLGIVERANRLIAASGPAGAEAVRSAVRRLVHPGAMGLLFKALAIAGPDLPAVPGFQPAGA
jgi:NADH dehydrogenase [ubiquinone] 1 alpha subcomplex assembly factor 7